MLLLERKLTLYPRHTKTTLVFTIPLQQPLCQLEIDTHYEPKYLTDPCKLVQMTQEGAKKWGLPLQSTPLNPEDCPEICNMITVSLDVNGKFCGYAHRHDPDMRSVITPQSASLGFYPMRLDPGTLRLMLPVCMVATEQVQYYLRVTGIPEGENR